MGISDAIHRRESLCGCFLSMPQDETVRKKIYLFACFLLFLWFGIVPIAIFGGLLRLFLRVLMLPSDAQAGSYGFLFSSPGCTCLGGRGV